MKPSAVHEDFSRETEVKTSTDRVFGLTMAAALGLLALSPLVRHRPMRPWVLALAAMLLVPALLRPRLLGPVNRLWLRLGLLMQGLVTPAIMALFFYGTLTPVAMVLRLVGKDLLGLRIDRTASTYWIERRPPGPAPGTMRQQF